MAELKFEQKMDNFTNLVYESANALDCIFFVESGEGRDMETDTLYCEDISGWLVPKAQEVEFTESSDKYDVKWDQYFVFAEWKQDGDNVKVNFNKYPIFYDTAAEELFTEATAV
jgi:sporulation-control protein spo0M